MNARKDWLTSHYAKLISVIRDIGEDGCEQGAIDPAELRLTVTAGRDAARKLIEAGASQREAAKILQVPRSTLQYWLDENGPDNGRNSSTHGPDKIAKWDSVAAGAAAAGATAAPSDKYRIVYADPPWSYSNTMPDYFGEQRDHYAVMPLADICALPVKDWVEGDAVLFLWATSPILEEAFQVVHAWGFEYKATFVWDKIKHVMGHYNSVRHELLLICTRGSCQPDEKQLIDSVQNIERAKDHSTKPVEFYDIIETLYTHGRRLEMFARSKREGWDAYGHVAEITNVAAE